LIKFIDRLIGEEQLTYAVLGNTSNKEVALNLRLWQVGTYSSNLTVTHLLTHPMKQELISSQLFSVYR
jgi:hypothetical protein